MKFRTALSNSIFLKNYFKNYYSLVSFIQGKIPSTKWSTHFFSPAKQLKTPTIFSLFLKVFCVVNHPQDYQVDHFYYLIYYFDYFVCLLW